MHLPKTMVAWSLVVAAAMAVSLPAQVLAWEETARESAPQVDEQAAKRQILESEDWRRAMFEVNSWLQTQQLYTPQQVEEIRADFRARVNDMSAAELGNLLADLKVKLQIMDAPQVREARAWMAEYVAVMSERRRADVLQDLPNLATLTPTQLHQEVLRIKDKRARLQQRQSAFGASQSQRVAAQTQFNHSAQQNVNRSRTSPPAAFSPYRPQSNVNDRLNSAVRDNRPTFFVDPFGGVGRTLPSSW